MNLRHSVEFLLTASLIYDFIDFFPCPFSLFFSPPTLSRQSQKLRYCYNILANNVSCFSLCHRLHALSLSANRL